MTTPYVLRMEMLKLAQDQVNARFYNAREARDVAINSKLPVPEAPTFPTTEEIIAEAAKLKSFVDSN
jgi:hypothetical protein